MLLLLSVFGNSLSLFISSHIKILESLAEWLMDKRIIISPIVLVGFSLLLYKFLPNRKDSFKNQIPGASFYCNCVAGSVMDIFGIFGYLSRIFRYVRKSYNNCADYAVAVFLYVQYSSGSSGK